MVSRKASLPYPTSPPPPPPQDFGFSRPNHDIDTSDIPPVPRTAPRTMESSQFQEMGNPWNDDAQHMQSHSRTSLPDILKPAGGRNPSPNKPAVQDESDVMKPGWSGQNTPRSSIDSHRSKDFWESSDEEKEGEEKKAKKKAEKESVAGLGSSPGVPTSLQIKRKPVATSPVQQQTGFSSNGTFASNNPFRRGMKAEQQDHSEGFVASTDTKGKGKGKGKGKEVDDEGHRDTKTSDTPFASTVPDLSAYNSAYHTDNANWGTSETTLPPPTQAAPPPIPQQAPPPIPEALSPFSSQPPLIPVSPPAADTEGGFNPWTTQPNIPAQPSPIPFERSQKQVTVSTDDLLDRGQHTGSLSLGDELKALPNHGPHTTSQTSLLDDAEPGPQLPERRYKMKENESFAPPPGPPPSHMRTMSRSSDAAPPTKPPRPAIVTKVPTQEELAAIREQRGETYQIKHFNWFDQRLGRSRSSSMLMQNKNGPCPLLALVNALILGATDHDQAMLDEFLRTREQVTLGTIIENLMMELLSRAEDGQLPDVDELNRFLMKLRTGMNMNPRLVPPPVPPPNLMDARNSMLHIPNIQPKDTPGTFEPTQDIRLYSAFSIQTMHGWLAEPGSDAATAFTRSAQTYEDAQAKLFGEDELEYKLTNDGLSPQEQVVWEDIISIKNFLNNFQSQLTPYGLHCIRSSMLPGEFAILFRNDHFNTIYKHPRDGKLYTLVTDAGFADKEEIWQSLVDTSGQNSDFFSGDFRPVSHDVAPPVQEPSRRQSDSLNVDVPPHLQSPLSPQERQEQSDADYAMALQIQLEEEDEQRRRRAQSQSNGSTNRPSGGRRSTGGNIPIPLRSNNSSQEVRPLIPARNARSNIPAVNRPTDADQSDAPPAYEEATRHKPYNPPLGSPLHPQSSPTPNGSPYNSTSQVNVQDSVPSSSGPRPGGAGRRSSAYHENHDRLGRPNQGSGRFEMGMSPAYDFTDGRMPGSYIHTGHGGHGMSVNASGGNNYGQVPRLTTRPGAGNMDRDRDCTVM